jgi:hypothetical protein
MQNTIIYAGYRYPFHIISHAFWLYHRFTLNFRDIEELLSARGITSVTKLSEIDVINTGKGMAVGSINYVILSFFKINC